MLTGKTVVVTGSSRGIGAAVARLAHGYGARVICHGSRESENLLSISDQLGTAPLICDLRDNQQLSTVFSELAACEARIDGLVNSAGTLVPVDLAATKAEHYQEAFQIHVAAPSQIAAALAERLAESGYGSIVNVASCRSLPHLASVRSAPYSAAKAAVASLTAVQAKQYGPKVRANAVSPGWTETEMSKEWNERSRQQARENLLQRIAQPVEIAEVICFLLSERSSFITAENIVIDGGYGLYGK